MKIVNRKTFLSLPVGTVFSKYRPCVFDEIMVKDESFENDFCYTPINDAIDCNNSEEYADFLLDSEKTGKNLEMDFECTSRDGMFDDDQLFAVWTFDDVVKLIERLQQAIL